MYSTGCEEFKANSIVDENSNLIKCNLVIFSSKPFNFGIALRFNKIKKFIVEVALQKLKKINCAFRAALSLVEKIVAIYCTAL